MYFYRLHPVVYITVYMCREGARRGKQNKVNRGHEQKILLILILILIFNFNCNFNLQLNSF
jgi:hypothetical protein